MRFLLLDRITSWKPGDSAEGVKNVALSEDFFDDHFPLKPIMPGALIVEGIAQLSGLLLEESVKESEDRKVKALMSIIEKAKFRIPAYPGDQLTYKVRISSFNEMGGKIEGEAYIAEQLAVQCALVFSFHSFDKPELEKRRSAVLELWLKGVADGK